MLIKERPEPPSQKTNIDTIILLKRSLIYQIFKRFHSKYFILLRK